ncbi:ABC-type Fe3+-siderophore transport system, permease component (plasmid) [Paracoccus aminophilus JCM 7686]|uniref:ABC-type Fe3+-siderophore transport system, permease component n=1 Tax=Paracoccus aminophilus JCM 7686 TaxID=1367847 RepID=S5YH73_PARAH|nr:ABC-type Fe3+-siderophore transport system, permease component [Paracoccus aminophilus JCM 7686]
MLALLLGLAAIASLGIGRFDLSFLRVVEILASPWIAPSVPVSPAEWSVVVVVRLPRIVMAVLAGAGLAVAGAALQGVFRNPLVGPQVVGVTSGAAFGGTLAILFGWQQAGLIGAAFAFGLLALVTVWLMSELVAKNNILVLVLAGVIVSGFFGALVSLVQFLADSQDKLPVIVFWLLGSFATANGAKALLLTGPVLVCGTLLMLLRWRINLLAMGDEDARALGVPVTALRWFLLVLTALLVSSQVAVSGMIGWVGLVVPHLARMLVGADHRRLLPASALLGGLFLLMVDNLARSLSSSEIPLGILTALIGTPVFALLLWRNRASRLVG